VDEKGSTLKADNDKLSHIDENGKAQMVDVGNKEDTKRSATASGKVFMSVETIEALKKQELQKGDVLGVARVAGIQAAKKTSDLIPLCHPLAVNFASVDFRIKESHVEIEATVKTSGKTGVEMEALTACSVTALTIYDMCKALDKSVTIEEIKLLEKTGGKSGDWHRPE
jgi:cyclic pyranopterin phosphate synthase